MSRLYRLTLTAEWYAPKFVFDALSLAFDLRVRTDDNLRQPWHGVTFINPTFSKDEGARNGRA